MLFKFSFLSKELHNYLVLLLFCTIQLAVWASYFIDRPYSWKKDKIKLNLIDIPESFKSYLFLLVISWSAFAFGEWFVLYFIIFFLGWSGYKVLQKIAEDKKYYDAYIFLSALFLLAIAKVLFVLSTLVSP